MDKKNVDKTLFTEFKRDVAKGLSATGKWIPSKYFYDDRGSRLFQEIMQLPEYYLTKCEYEIFKDHSSDIAAAINNTKRKIDIIELGAGDGTKTQLLLEELQRIGAQFRYIPVDISVDSNSRLRKRLKSQIPGAAIEPIDAEYFDALEEIGQGSKNLQVLLFLGSNVGNFEKSESLKFFRVLASFLRPGDMVLTGFDLKKDPSVILEAYNDKQGITREFNLNLLARINRELSADFVIGNFEHWPVYDPRSGAARSYLVSKTDQGVTISELDKTFAFRAWETIATEISQKYDTDMIHALAAGAGFKVIANFSDTQNYFVDSLWRLEQ